MRFELAAAYAMGVALPALEVLRRRTHFDTISGYVDDFIAGGLLGLAGEAQRPGAPGASRRLRPRERDGARRPAAPNVANVA